MTPPGGAGDEREQRLAGGNMGAVSRLGGTVLRPAGPWTPTVHRLLRHLRAHGFDAAPEPLGVRSDGREVLSYLPGTVPLYPLPAEVWSEAVLVDAARLLRRWHDASAGFPLEDAVWQAPVHEPAEVVCHGDFSPHNLVLRDGRVIGVIDVDMAAPGPRLRDLAYLATRLVPLGRDHPAWTRPEEARERLRILLGAYGPVDPAALLDEAETRLRELADFTDGKAVELARPDLHEHADGYRADAAWLRSELQPHLAPTARRRPDGQPRGGMLRG